MSLESIDDIRANGFEGFVKICDLQTSNCHNVPIEAGVYLVLRTSPWPPTFLVQSTGGTHKGKTSTVDISRLKKKWIEGALVLNIGKAGGSDIQATLRRRLKAYMCFGLGKSSGHRGGRYIWQLGDAENLLVCWKPTLGSDPRSIERAMIMEFKQQHDGKRPFANLNN